MPGKHVPDEHRKGIKASPGDLAPHKGSRRLNKTIPRRTYFTGPLELKILREGPAASSYELKNNGRQMRLHFVVGADQRFFPVSLASMVSKYLRELLVDNMNRYFTGFNPDLRPTAGYWKDGLRFIEDLKKNVPHVPFDSNQLIRCR